MGPLTEGDDDGNTPLDADAIQGLIPVWVATRADLNEVEAENVASGYAWLRHNEPTIPSNSPSALFLNSIADSSAMSGAGPGSTGPRT